MATEAARPAADAPAEFVADATAVGKLFLDEPESEALRDWWYARLRAGDRIVAPPVLAAELGNVIRRNLDTLDDAAQRRVWRDALAGIAFLDDGMPDAFTHRRLTFYDGCYVALALARGAALVSYDRDMRAVVKEAGGEAVAPS